MKNLITIAIALGALAPSLTHATPSCADIDELPGMPNGKALELCIIIEDAAKKRGYAEGYEDAKGQRQRPVIIEVPTSTSDTETRRLREDLEAAELRRRSEIIRCTSDGFGGTTCQKF